jgi:hypothetical protein
MPCTRAPDGCGRAPEPKSECDIPWRSLAGRRALKAHYVVGELADHHEFGMCSQSRRIERGLQLHTLADCPSSQALSIHDRCKAVNEAENPELLYAASASSCCPVRSIARR